MGSIVSVTAGPSRQAQGGVSRPVTPLLGHDAVINAARQDNPDVCRGRSRHAAERHISFVPYVPDSKRFAVNQYEAPLRRNEWLQSKWRHVPYARRAESPSSAAQPVDPPTVACQLNDCPWDCRSNLCLRN